MKFFSWCRRYVSLLFLLFIVLFIYVVFFDENSYSNLTELKKREAELRKEIKADQDSADFYLIKNKELNSSDETLERVAREHFYMQGPNEEIYIVK